MFEEVFVRNCAPTLAGLKIGSLFNIRYEACDLLSSIRSLNRRLGNKGVRIIPINRSLVYVYRPEKLREYFLDNEVRAILQRFGYPLEDTDLCVRELARRIVEETCFPHEVGLFLGYPAEDVLGFIEHGARDSKCVGCWKVYGDEDEANRKFLLYRKCTDIYLRQYGDGRSLEKLTITA